MSNKTVLIQLLNTITMHELSLGERWSQMEAKVCCQSIPDWVSDIGIGMSTYHTIPKTKRPRTVKVGRRVFVIEPASEWVQRIAEEEGGAISTSRQKSAEQTEAA
jgi:hypothetical protein